MQCLDLRLVGLGIQAEQGPNEYTVPKSLPIKARYLSRAGTSECASLGTSPLKARYPSQAGTNEYAMLRPLPVKARHPGKAGTERVCNVQIFTTWG